MAAIDNKVIAGAAGSIIIASAALLAQITGHEGTVKTAYKDTGGVTTVCNGHTGPDIEINKVYTKKDCDNLLIQDVTKHGQGVLSCVKVPLSQNTYDALTSFAYNVGVSGMCTSRAVALLNMGEHDKACAALANGPKGYRSPYCKTKICQSFRLDDADPVWSYDRNRTFLRGLYKRRLAEKNMCLTPEKTEVSLL